MKYEKKKSLSERDLFIWNEYIKKSNFSFKKKFFEKISFTDSSFQIKNFDEGYVKKNKKILERPKIFSLNKKTLKKIKKNSVRPDKILDLHGKSQIEAKNMIFNFIINCYRNNDKFLLIITGKGSKISDENLFLEKGSGVLKRNFPKWIKEDYISKYIISSSLAHDINGGEGAFYVFLKRNKNL